MPESFGAVRFPRLLAHFALLLALTLPAASPARADDFVTRVNAIYTPIPAARRSDKVLLPLLAKVAPLPVPDAALSQAQLLPADSPAFKPYADWAAAQPQQDFIKALHDLGKISDWHNAPVFAQPYGADDIAPDLVRAGLYTDLGDPPTLAGARHLYLPALDRAAILVNVNATRLQADGKPGEAIDALIDWACLCRSMCDRQFFTEVSWGFRNLANTMERVRDVGYVDMRGPRKLDPDNIIAILDRLAANGYFDLSRITFPMGDRAGTEQMLARVYVPRGKVDDRLFGPSLARLGSTQHPLRIFSETSRWRDAAARQAPAEETSTVAAGVYDDWQSRWNFSLFDPRNNNITERAKLGEGDRMQAIVATTPPMGSLFDDRQIAGVECAGTRTTLAALGAFYARGALPPQLSAVRPRFVSTLDDDPYNPTSRNLGGKPPFEYFVPMRDTPKDDRGNPAPYEMDVVTSDASHPLSLRMTDDTFVLYSRGSDYAKNFAKRTQNTPARVEGADYLIWPPVMSLERVHLQAAGVIK